MIRERPWFRELVAIGWPIVFYWIGIVLSLVVLTICVFVTQDAGIDTKDFLALGAIWTASVLGVLVGQAFSLTRLRSSLFQPCMFLVFLITTYLLATHEETLEPLLGKYGFLMLMMVGMLGPIMGSGGFWSLRVNRGLMASWGPTLLVTGGILMVSEHYNDADAWHAGNKYAIWSFSTLGILLASVVLQLAFMVARERHRVHRWMTAPVAAEQVRQRPDPIRPFAGLGTWILLGLLMLTITGTSAIVAPYLWRTGPGDHELKDDPADPADPQPDENGDLLPDMSGPIQVVQQLVSMMCTLLTMLILAIAALLIFGPPTRRQLLLTHLRQPLWPVTPSRRAHLHWRLAEIAMGDAGVHRAPGETALEAAQRTVVLFPDVNLEALTTAAEISDRVAYGYTLHPSDADTIRRAAEMTYQAVWDTLGEIDRLKNTYRPL